MGRGSQCFARASEVLHQAFAHASIKGLLAQRQLRCKKKKKKKDFGKVEVFFFIFTKSQTSRLAAAEDFMKASHDLFISGGAPLN